LRTRKPKDKNMRDKKELKRLSPRIVLCKLKMKDRSVLRQQ
jgi:hypothetical protein